MNNDIVNFAEEVWDTIQNPVRRKFKRMLKVEKDWKTIVPNLQNFSKEEIEQFTNRLKVLANENKF